VTRFDFSGASIRLANKNSYFLFYSAHERSLGRGDSEEVLMLMGDGTASEGRVAIITGASRGLGRALAASLGGRGWNLVIDARGEDTLRDVEEELAGRSDVTAIAGDVTDENHLRSLVAAAARHGRLDLLVNNASSLGPSPLPPLADLGVDELAAILRVNTLAPMRLIQLALPLLEASRGRIINVTSDASVGAYEGWGGYGASKAALEQISNILAAEHPDLRIYWVDPGDMNTQMHQDAYPGEDISDRPPPEASVPGLLRLVDRNEPSGRYQTRALIPDRA
jgi:NAD(P)-dependent dehydrogenase (short-subunit alcohol dehydrogenase family)